MKCLINIILICLSLVTFCVAKEPEKQTEPSRLVVQSLVPGGSAEKAGVLPKDILVKYDGKPVNTLKQINELKEQLKTDSVEVIILRERKKLAIKLPKGQLGVYLRELFEDVKYKTDAVVIENVPKLSWETGKYNTFFASLEAVANYLNIKKDYIDVSGMSGSLFRLHFFKSWCLSSPDPTCGFNSGEEALKALGLEFKSYGLASDGKNKPEIKQAIMNSIYNKTPVIAIDLIQTSSDWGIITGFQNNGEELICRTYFDKRNSYEIAEKFPFGVYIITGQQPIIDDIDIYKNSFKTIEQNLTTEMYDEYYSGLIAFDKWIEGLSKTNFATLDSEKYENCVLANAWSFDRLVEDRANAVLYLKRVQEQMPDLSKKIEQLAKIYQEETDILKAPKGLVIYPFNMKDQSDWTAEMRKQQVEVLKSAKVKEEAALEIWKEIVK